MVDFNGSNKFTQSLGQSLIDCYVSTGSQHECIVLPSRVWNILNNFSFRVKEWIADKGYGRGPTYGYFKLLGITTYIPLHVDNLGEGKISRGEFQYDREQDRYKINKQRFVKKPKNIADTSTTVSNKI